MKAASSAAQYIIIAACAYALAVSDLIPQLVRFIEETFKPSKSAFIGVWAVAMTLICVSVFKQEYKARREKREALSAAAPPDDAAPSK